MKKNLIVIGGGAVGAFATANLNPHLYNVKILEQNSEVLQKVKISGGGRCNVTNACFNPKDLVNYYPRGSRELLSVFTKFQPADTMEWFENRNVKLKIENDNRVFPISNSSQSIIDCLLNEISKKNFQIITNTVVKSVDSVDGGYIIKTNKEDYSADIVVFCTGSSPKSFKILENLGHKIIEPVPSLFTFNIKDKLLQEHQGTAFENAYVSIPFLNSEENGSLLITHWGLSGPAILRLSAWNARELFNLKYQFDLIVNFIGIDIGEAEAVFKEYRSLNTKKTIGQSKIFEVTKRFWTSILNVSNIDFNKQISQLNKKEIDLILNHLCQKKLRVEGKSTFKDEFVTAGGVDLKEIDFKTMKSKKLNDFFIAGEVLNIDAITGGFNFQACWSEGWLISEYLNNI